MAGGTNSVKAMHYDFKQKLNKIDSQQYRNLRVPEIDWKINEGLYVFIKRIAQPRTSTATGFESDTRSIDDIRTLVERNKQIDVTDVENAENVVAGILPDDYMFRVGSRCLAEKDSCIAEITANIQKHTRDFQNDMFGNSSFEWREVNGLFVGNTIQLFTDGTFSITKLLLDYIRKPKYIHSAEDAVGGKYKLLDGTELTGFQNCELPEIVHGDIVDLAVLITTGDLISDYQAKFSKIQIVDN